MSEIDRNTVRGGKTVYGAAVGILVLETKFPRMPGDIGYAPTWPSPVLYGGVRGASKNADAATSLIKFLTASAAAPVFKAKGMEPG